MEVLVICLLFMDTKGLKSIHMNLPRGTGQLVIRSSEVNTELSVIPTTAKALTCGLVIDLKMPTLLGGRTALSPVNVIWIRVLVQGGFSS